ncbi:MAG: hypothetical protein BWY76_01117 [bacterium ADurb.Bin429]|nr:MAG: hypothetical protein BWY76_01117 [bacterium ADurb.Bin429]
MRCPRCGLENPDSALICGRCRSRLTSPAPSGTSPDRLTLLAGISLSVGILCAGAVPLVIYGGFGLPLRLLLLLAFGGLAAGLILFHVFGNRDGMREDFAVRMAWISWVALVALFILITIHPPFIRPPHNPPRHTCINNQRQLAIAIEMYCQDYELRYPTAFADLADYTVARMYTCPDSGGGYGYNGVLIGHAQNELANPAATLLTADSHVADIVFTAPEQIARDRHVERRQRGFFASYGDGHAVFVLHETVVTLESVWQSVE